MALNKVFKALLFIENNNYLGQCKSITVPGPTAATSPHETLSSLGSIELPTGFDAMNGEIEWQAMSELILKYAANTRDVFSVQVRSNLEEYGGTVNKVDKSLVYFMRLRFGNIPNADFTAKTDMSSTTNYHCVYIRCVLDGKDMYEFDPINNIYKVLGVSLIDQEKLNLGLI